jgi:hypothetical protein
MEHERPLYAVIKEVLEGMPGDAKADPPVYENRLEICKNCRQLQGGMCKICGCFVEVRAAGKGHYCPDTPKKWG